jgi:hypothetical protein
MNATKTLKVALIACVALFAAATAADAQVGWSTSAAVSHGDANADGTLDMADVRTMLAILFDGEKPFVSGRDLDHNADGKFDISDVDAALRGLQRSGPRPAPKTFESVISGDANDDGKVDIADLSALGAWLTGGAAFAAPKEAADLNRDGKVDITDLSILAKSIAG